MCHRKATPAEGSHAQGQTQGHPPFALTCPTPNHGHHNNNTPKFTLGKLTQTGLEFFFFSAANMNYLVFLKLGGISNACGNDLPDDHPSLLKTFGQLGAIIVTIRHLGPALLRPAVLRVRQRWERYSAALHGPARHCPRHGTDTTTLSLRPGPC